MVIFIVKKIGKGRKNEYLEVLPLEKIFIFSYL